MVTQKCEHTDGTRNKNGNFFLPLTYILTPDFRPHDAAMFILDVT